VRERPQTKDQVLDRERDCQQRIRAVLKNDMLCLGMGSRTDGDYPRARRLPAQSRKTIQIVNAAEIGYNNQSAVVTRAHGCVRRPATRSEGGIEASPTQRVRKLTRRDAIEIENEDRNVTLQGEFTVFAISAFASR
jgi:hypothetical protein